MLEKLFKLRENGTDVRTEVMAGITTFMTMAYILAVNPSILSATGMDSGAIFTSTALAAMIGTFLMAFFANYPFALAPGMGLNAYFAYTVVLGMGYKWEVALTAVFVEGIVFIVLSRTNIREAIFNAIPKNLKSAVSVGIGLFIAFIGLQNANIVVGGSTLLELFSIDGYNSAKGVEASMNNVGITVLLALIGVGITGILVIKNVKGNILWGILLTWILGIICQMAGIYVPDPELTVESVDLVEVDGKTYTTNVNEAIYDWAGESTPKVSGGLNTNVSWKNLSLSLLFNFQLGGKMYDVGYSDLMTQPSGSASLTSNKHVDILNRWQKPGDVTNVPRIEDFADTNMNAGTSTRWLISSNMLELASATLSYDLPKQWLEKVSMQGLRVYASGENLFLLTKRKGIFPRSNIFSGYSGNADVYLPARVFTFGLNLTF